jgi:outer membrane protein OmpA-like peptidoglycan-associated protein
MKTFKLYILLLVINFLLASVAFGQEDEEGGQDYPLFPRMEGFYITGYQNGDFLVGGKPQGYKFQINYELKEGATTDLTDEQIVQNLVKTAKKLGARTLTNDGYAATLSLRHKGENLWIQLGAFGPSYELIVVEKGSKGPSKAIHGDTPIVENTHKVQTLAKVQQITITSNGVVSGIDKTKNTGLVLNPTTSNINTNSTTNSNYTTQTQITNTNLNNTKQQVVTNQVGTDQNDAENSHDYWLFPRFEDYYIRDYEETDFVVGKVVKGYKYRINYELKRYKKAPADNKIVGNHINIVKSKGGKSLTNDGYAATMELKKDGKDLWVQVGSFGNGYEVIVVEKGNIRSDALAQGNIRKAHTTTGMGQKITIQNGNVVGQNTNTLTNTTNSNTTQTQTNSTNTNTNSQNNTQNSTIQNSNQNTTVTQNPIQNTTKTKEPLPEVDVASSQDYPLFDRLGNYYIRDYEETDFVVGTKVEGYKYRINYELKEGVTAPTDKQVVRNHISKVKAEGGKVLTNDGYASTMELKKGGKNLWIQVGSFGNGYEVIVVEKGNIRKEALTQGNIRKPHTIAGMGQRLTIQNGNVIGGTNTTNSRTQGGVITYAQNTNLNSNSQNQTKQQGGKIVGNTKTNEANNQVTRTVAEVDMDNSRDYPLFDRLDDYYIRDYEETDFVVGTKVKGYKYRINYELKEGQNPPTDKQVVRNHIRKVRAEGGKTLTNDGYASTMELKKDGKDLWIQVGSFGNGYEVIVVEKGNIRPAALRQGNILRPHTIAGLGQKVTIIDGKVEPVTSVSTALTSNEIKKTNSATRLALVAKAIEAQGFIDINELEFTDKTATLEDKAKANIADIAQMLKDNPTLNLVIVAHTSKGKSILDDLSLSEQRANLIVKMLSQDYGIALQRLEAKGLGSFAPVASEATAKGRQANNRVVLIKK